jgi:hypothetical protein
MAEAETILCLRPLADHVAVGQPPWSQAKDGMSRTAIGLIKYPSDYTLKRSSFGRTISEWFAQPERDLVNTLRS